MRTSHACCRVPSDAYCRRRVDKRQARGKGLLRLTFVVFVPKFAGLDLVTCRDCPLPDRGVPFPRASLRARNLAERVESDDQRAHAEAVVSQEGAERVSVRARGFIGVASDGWHRRLESRSGGNGRGRGGEKGIEGPDRLDAFFKTLPPLSLPSELLVRPRRLVTTL